VNVKEKQEREGRKQKKVVPERTTFHYSAPSFGKNQLHIFKKKKNIDHVKLNIESDWRDKKRVGKKEKGLFKSRNLYKKREKTRTQVCKANMSSRKTKKREVTPNKEKVSSRYI